ncbi:MULTISPECIES: hypothetical protein [Clostridium]|uniref:Uncharacterized protein n=2 Tax=Clostridium TaxID=1485 RepID=D8GK26_CLOLD|nr:MULTISPECIES: hypothetical protein [Clostridium]ADK13144.1 hypothetical protein CLJU_c00370 [Clostridium ljungdahlii DSM 13528]AGY76367.1 hypothetical protein CAETHG_2154 [Clostridium autoethanogenum DSM 10061]ALU36530.1 Hypothetical protein CLAU_2101 [Clostridium autoethanogenum DSM 10061]OAA84382.1 hypothetical protein WX45_01045 [Clostridium ljungdahlii DSM 13528]OVY48616.1 hypothetical protein WX72_00437 [Clostridium autoethanogenum]
MKNQLYKEKAYEFNIVRECEILSISCKKIMKAIDNTDLELMSTSFNFIVSSCNQIRRTKAPLKYVQIYKDIRRVCNLLMKIYHNIFHRFIDEIWVNKYNEKISEVAELLKIPLSKIENVNI